MRYRTKILYTVALVVGLQMVLVSAGVARGLTIVETYNCAKEEAIQIANGTNVFSSKCKELS